MKTLLLILMAGMVCGAQIPSAAEAWKQSSAVAAIKARKAIEQSESMAWLKGHRVEFEKAVGVVIAEAIKAGDSNARFNFWKFADKFEARSIVSLDTAMNLLRTKGYRVEHACYGYECYMKIDWTSLDYQKHPEHLDRPCTPETAKTCDAVKP